MPGGYDIAVILLMTARTLHRRALVTSAGVALVASYCQMRARQRELSPVVIKRCGLPGGCAVTGLAVGRESGRYMVGIGGRIELLLMTSNAC